MTSIATQRNRIHRADRLAEQLTPHGWNDPIHQQQAQELDEQIVGKEMMAEKIAEAVAAQWGSDDMELGWNAKAVMA